MGIRNSFTTIRVLAHNAIEKYLASCENDDNYWTRWKERWSGWPNSELMRAKTDAENVLSRSVCRWVKYRHYKRTSDEISAILDERRASGIFIPEPQRHYITHQPTVVKRATQTKIVRQEPEKTKKRRIRLGIGIGFWF